MLKCPSFFFWFAHRYDSSDGTPFVSMQLHAGGSLLSQTLDFMAEWMHRQCKLAIENVAAGESLPAWLVDSGAFRHYLRAAEPVFFERAHTVCQGDARPPWYSNFPPPDATDAYIMEVGSFVVWWCMCRFCVCVCVCMRVM